MQRMYKVTVATSFLVLLAGVQIAKAADFGLPSLRGSIQPQPVQTSEALWDGFYVGALAGYSSTVVSKAKGYPNLAPQMNGLELSSQSNIPSTLITPSRSGSGAGFGAFVGYNSTWEDAVVGIEADYMRMSIKTNSSLAVGAQFVGTSGYRYNYTAAMTAAQKITDIATLRGRVGYAYGNVLPFITAGLAIGHGKFTNNSSVTGTAVDTAVPAVKPLVAYNYTGGYNDRDKFAAGVALGAGFDYAFSPSIFFRAEYQYIRFSSLGGAQVSLNNARAGVAAKF